MKILRIAGSNLASLAGDFCVDFEQEPLAGAGLFAISGPTGAGKTTLLDALCLALYDATPRMARTARASLLPDVGDDTVSAQDPRTLLRRGAAEAHAEVDFVGNDQVRYRARWSIRRSRGKATGALQKATMSLHRLPDLLAIGGTKTEVADEIARRIGLSFEQFTRAVLLAQNEFSAFLKTEENERGELLETLTGSAIYSRISRRAFDRFKSEQAAMQQLGARLADQTPMAAEARSEAEAACAAAEAALQLADARKASLEQQVRWRQEADKLEQGEAQAGAALALARTAVADAGARRAHLALLDLAEPARPLLADSVRLAAEAIASAAAIEAAGTALQAAAAAQEQAAAALASTTAQWQAAQQARASAAPMLDQAKALDAGIAALAPSHAQARQAEAAAAERVQLAERALAANTEALAATTDAQEAGARWLAAHADWERLADQWARWDTLLGQAAAARHAQQQADAGLARAAAQLATATAREQQAAAALAGASAQLAILEQQRQAAIANLAAFNGEQLRQRRSALDARRHDLVAASGLSDQLAVRRRAADDATAQSSTLLAAATALEATLAGATEAGGALAAALAQAERSQQVAELACAASVVDLRAQLVDDAPCPVCGSLAHPYHDGNAVLNDMLERLRAEVQRCRGELQEQRTLEASSRAELAAKREQRALALQAQAEHAAAVERLGGDLAALAILREAPGEQERGAWLAAALAQASSDAATLAQQEDAMHAAGAQRELAQSACDAMATAHAAHQASAVQAAPALVRAQAAHAALLEQCSGHADTLATLLADLDAVFGADPHWQRQWQADPGAYRTARAADVAAWRSEAGAQAARSTAMLTLRAQHEAAQQQLAQATASHASAAAACNSANDTIGALRAERAALWGGRAAADVEQALAGAIATAQAAVDACQASAQGAAQAHARQREALAQASARQGSVQQQAALAAKALDAWLAQSGAGIGDALALGKLLATERSWSNGERAALRALDAAADSAATILAERSSQRALHQQGAPEQQGDPATLAAALEAVSAERTHAHDAAGALRVQLAQDDARRASARSLMAEIDKQQAVELRWARMNDLIGSADGKKFRNYAQQFTLDVLLGYANSHLGQLARRYRLERIASNAGPSLGLMVRDQDMGGEIRSVNSLSGGESFLVSLALALGLASLSSNRVRVESLFIDEGFGSLDSETLRVAMDALDGLQAMGRKVGVISHVQEMTDRIATRILVQPAGGGSSTVTVQ
jgi:exonuclease SbcC